MLELVAWGSFGISTLAITRNIHNLLQSTLVCAGYSITLSPEVPSNLICDFVVIQAE